jgi:hypothetical protein
MGVVKPAREAGRHKYLGSTIAPPLESIDYILRASSSFSSFRAAPSNFDTEST